MKTSHSEDTAGSAANQLRDAQLVAQLLSGNSAAWNELIEQYGRLIRGRVSDVARSFGYLDEAAIDDATADLFTALFANDLAALRAFAGRSSLSTYLAVIATRVATRVFARRRAMERLQVPDQRFLDQLVALGDQMEPGHRMQRAEQRQQLLQMIEALPSRQRDVVKMYHIDGLSYAEISAALEIPLGSVGVTLMRGEASLKKQLNPLQT